MKDSESLAPNSEEHKKLIPKKRKKPKLEKPKRPKPIVVGEFGIGFKGEIDQLIPPKPDKPSRPKPIPVPELKPDSMPDDEKC